TLIVFVPLMLANAILLEAGLSYLGAGVQPPNPSWGTMIADGISSIPAAIHLVLVPGIMLVLAVLSINVFGDGVRDALDPRAQIRHGLPATLSLALGAGFIWLMLGILFGVVTAIKAGRFADKALTVLAFVGVSCPPFFLGALVIYYLGYKAGIVPLGGYVPLSE